jgi:hypothetical protein
MTLQYWKEVKDSYDNLKVEGLTTRDLEVIKPILAIAKVVGREVYDSILEWYIEYMEQEKIKDFSNNWEFHLLSELWQQFKDNEDKDEKQLFVKKIAESIGPSLFDSETENYKKNMNRLYAFIGGRIKNYVLFKGGRSGGRTYYNIYKKGLKQILEARGLLEILDFKKVEGVDGVEVGDSKTSTIYNYFKNELQQEKKEEKTPFNDYKKIIPKIEEIMKSKPKTEWKINDICFNLGIASLSARNEITALLEKTVSDPKNKTNIQKVDKNGFYWRLRNE